jgi:hypothetical protein
MKIRTFWALYNAVLDEEVNQFLSKIKPENVLDLKYSTSSDNTRNTTVFSVAILYEEEKDGEI